LEAVALGETLDPGLQGSLCQSPPDGWEAGTDDIPYTTFSLTFEQVVMYEKVKIQLVVEGLSKV
jgi:hypothetical protein